MILFTFLIDSDGYICWSTPEELTEDPIWLNIKAIIGITDEGIFVVG